MCRARDNLACEAGLAARAVGFRALVILYPSLPSGPLGLTGSATATRHTAFWILAGYIFGKNKGEKKLTMTAPVIQSAAPGAYRVQFV